MRSTISSVGITALSAYITTTLSATIPLPRSQEYDIFPRDYSNKPILTKPPIKPPFSEAIQDKDLRSELQSHQYHYDEWNEYWIPQHCLSEAEYNQLSGDDFDIRTVWYDDCAAPWVVCRHRLARENWETILTTFSQVPVGMRQYLANLVILPTFKGSKEMAKAAAYTRGAVMVTSPTFFKLGVLFHEFTHILDTIALSSYIVAQKLGTPGTPFSDTKIWKAAYENDTHVPTAYAKMTMQENFADVGRWGMSDIVHSDHAQEGPAHGSVGAGLQSYSAGWEGFRYQVWAFRKFLGPVIFTATGKCTGKVRTSPPVPAPMAMDRVMFGSGVRKRPNLKDVPVDGDEEGVVVEDIKVPEEVSWGVHVYVGRSGY
ncbi:hypothetical protein V8F06_014103 [Rhypophila decipiens]